MKREREERGVRLFVFHDDNFFLPHLPTNLARYRRLGELLEGEGLTDVGLVVKCRPNDVDAELFRGGVVVAGSDALPLSARQQVRIALRGRDGRNVSLEATTPFTGPQTIAWTVTAGEMLGQEGPRLRWRLPAQPGLYQAEVVVDYGALGLSFDALALEVI